MNFVLLFLFYTRLLIELATHLEEHELRGDLPKDTPPYVDQLFQDVVAYAAFLANPEGGIVCEGAALLKVIPMDKDFRYHIRAAWGNLKEYIGKNPNIRPNPTLIISDLPKRPKVKRDERLIPTTVISARDFISSASGAPVHYPDNWQPKSMLLVPCYFHKTLLADFYFHYSVPSVNLSAEQQEVLQLIAKEVALVLRHDPIIKNTNLSDLS